MNFNKKNKNTYIIILLCIILLLIYIFLFIILKNRKYYNNMSYSENNGFSPNLWGPSVWHFLHLISFNYPVNPSDQDKSNYKNFILNLQKILPCGSCRINFENHLNSSNIDEFLENRLTFSKYIYNLHNKVNFKLHKKNIPSYEKVSDYYNNMRALNSDNRNFKTYVKIKKKFKL